MKNTIITLVLLLSASYTVQAQFNNKGYKDIKIGMTLGQVEKLTKSVIKESVTTIKYHDIELKLEFDIVDPNRPKSYKLYSITTTSPKAKIDNNPEPLIGKRRTEVQKILGSKFTFPETEDTYYHLLEEINENEVIYMKFEFNTDGILQNIAVLKP